MNDMPAESPSAEPGDPSRRLLLASTSRYRRELLNRLGLDFEVVAPNADETPLTGETGADLAGRLAALKARSVAADHPDALIIASDQVAELDGRLLGKPGDFARTCEQLAAASGKTVQFHTGLCLLDTRHRSEQLEVVPFNVVFRNLTPVQIERYVARERPYDCAGGFKSEGLGIMLFERLIGDDPNTLIGLPLIRLCRMLERAGVELP